MANALDPSIEPNRFMQLLRRFSDFPALRLCLLIAPLLGASDVAHAEGGTCPSGYYPVSSPGVMGCAPIPNQAGDSAQDTTPRVTWVDRWGAIASDNRTGNVGTIGGQTSKRKARQIALERCGAGCKIDMVYYNQCAAIAWGTGSYSVNGSATADEASTRAMGVCGQGANDCKIIFTECSLPERSQ